MKNIFTTLLLFLAGATIVNAQTQGFSCTAGEETLNQYAKHPQLLVAKAQLDAFTKKFVAQRKANPASQRSTAPYIVPVVFHIEHDAGTEDIPDSLVYVEMEHWNEYMSASNADLSTTDAAFDTLIGNPNVEFRLAQIDPNGNPTNGIERIYTQSTYYGDNNTKLDPWPPQKYLNVWLTKGIDRDVTNYGTLAYSMYPSAVATYVNNDIIDGIIAKYFVVGSNDQFDRPTLAHECGHWMNLEHTWGNTNSPQVACGDDEVDDTPITKGNQNTCIHNLSICSPPIIENEQNIMNYAQCHFMFTKGQVDRMTAALNSAVAGRINVWSDSNLVATGCSNPLTYPVASAAVPVADFAASKRFTCPGTNVTFTDVSWNAPITGRTWTFPADATLSGNSSVNDVAPVVSFATSGWKEVTLVSSNSNGSSTKTKSMVYVSDGNAILAPYFEGFENPSEYQANWQVLNYDNNNTLFQPYNVGHYSNTSFRMNMYNADYDGDRDDLVSPILDLTSVDPNQMTFSFDYSFATYDASHMNDSVATISVYASSDCGSTWSRLYYNLGGFNLYNAGAVTTGAYVPGQQDEFWQNISVNIPSAFQGSSVVFKVSLTSAEGANQFYIDNINVGQSTTGINNVKVNTIGSMNIVPNPAQGAATLILNTTSPSANTTATMIDMAGRTIMTIYSGQLESGQKNIAFDTENIAQGIYTVKVSDGKSSIQKRFVKM